MLSSFWKNKRVLITGHTGFKGSWLSLWLQKKGASVTGYSLLPPTEPSFFEIGEISEGMISITGDVRDLEHLKAVIIKYQPEIVFHLAAQPLVRFSYEQPVETYETNIMGTINVLEAVRKTDCVKVIVIITSDKCYENKEWLWGYRESEPMGGQDPYSSSKACAELITASYRNSFFSNNDLRRTSVAVASARAGNVIGGGDWGKDRLVPDIIRAIISDRVVKIRNPHAIRPWQHVLEPLNGYLCLAERLYNHGEDFAEPWNFGPNDEGCKPVSWIVNKLDQLWAGSIQWELDLSKNPHEANYLKLDSSKAKNKLGWKLKMGLDNAMGWIVEWYSAYLGNQNMREFSEDQISRYENMEVS